MDILVPDLGESVVEATVTNWLKHEGDSVKVGEALVELETDKVNLEVSAEKAGVLVKIIRAAGEDVKIGDVLGTIEEAAVGTVPTPVKPETKAAVETKPVPETKVTPVAHRMAEQNAVDLAQVAPSGPGGRTTKNDVQRFIEERENPATAPTAAPAKRITQEIMPPTSGPKTAAPVSAAPYRKEERVRMSRRRQTIAKRLVDAQHTAAMLTTFNEIDMSAIQEVREKRKDGFKERHGGISLGLSSFFVKATIGALKAFPRLNAEIDGEEMVIKHYYDIGIAVGAEEGLVVPVLRDADRLSFAEIEKHIKDFAKAAREGSLSLEALRGGTFTITNGGVFGSLMSTPILNPPQVGILGLHKIEQRPIALNGQVVIRPMMYVALSYDHRIVDGSEAVQFLVRVKELCEDPTTLLIEG
jgi:2-oxoglutarate dehydrogenase E2 component (dihydrolipoamide succinyltransferase)